MPDEKLHSELLSPVESILTDRADEKPKPGTALCLSGGGYRAMLFHVGALVRLNEMGMLPAIDRVSSVSGGSITAGVLGLNWEKLKPFDASGVSSTIQRALVDPIRRMAGETIDVASILGGLFSRGSIADKVVKAYRKVLFGDASLQALPDRPRFVINATNVQSKALCRFSKPYMWDWRVGKIDKPEIELAVAVAASSAFPPVLSPVELHLDPSRFVPGTGKELQRPPFTSEVVLTDGGVYDNLGLETAWKNYEIVLVSDGGGKYGPEEDPARDWLGHTRRIMDLVDNQVRSLRKRQMVGSFKTGLRKGAYWSIGTDIADYHLTDALPCPCEKTEAIAGTATRLKHLEPSTQEKIINWGYAVCDAAMRKYGGMSQCPAPTAFPSPIGVG